MDATNQKQYEKALAPHQIRWAEVRAYEQQNAAKKKEDLLYEDDPNIGWKLHLNVEPVFVKLVSDYLRGTGHVHKYLSGGEIQDGKVFTLYIGSYALAQRCAHAISEALTPLLCLSKPGDNQEIEFAAGVVGRFSGEKKQGFDAYGSCGFSLLKADKDAYVELLMRNKNGPTYTQDLKAAAEEAEINAFRKLQAIYGGYFFA